jgi:cell division protein FtsQ
LSATSTTRLEPEGSAAGTEPAAGLEPRLEISLPRRGRVLGVAGFVLLAAMAWWVSTSPLFRMHSLDVVGNHRLSTSRVAALGGLTSSTNVLWLRASTIEHRLEANPMIASARVTRQLPSTIMISVTERTPVGLLGRGRSPLIVAGDGMILGRAGGVTTDLPIIRGMGGRSVPVSGGRVHAGDPALAAVASLSPSVRARVATVKEQRDGFVVLRMRAGYLVRFGDGTRAKEKGRVLAALLAWARDHGVTPRSIDVAAPDAPALHPA